MTRKTGAYTRTDGALVADRRLAPARRYRKHVSELIEHIGRSPTPTQRRLIERTAMLLVRVSYLDEKILAAADFTDHDERHYLAWANAVRRNLVALGLENPASDQEETIEDLMERVAASRN